MKSWLTASALLVVVLLMGCGDGIPAPLPSEIADPGETFATSIRDDVASFIEEAKADPSDVADAAEVLLESLEDTSAAGKYSDTVAKIKEKVSALASGSGSVDELAALMKDLPGGEEGGDDEPLQE